MEKTIYLDNSASSPLDPRVLEAMLPFFMEDFANATSNHHAGSVAMEAIKTARAEVSGLLNCRQQEIVFTSGATESLNMAIKGLALSAENSKTKILTISTEHKAVLENCGYLENIGFDVHYFPVNALGEVDLKEISSYIDEHTLALCVMLVNNETGVIQPIKQLAEICNLAGAYLICDATQAVGKLAIDVKELKVDLLCLSAHKFHGPKGTGALYIRKGISLSPLIHGGGQEAGQRSGSLNVPGIVGLGVACRLAKEELANNQALMLSLRDKLEQSLLKIDGTMRNGHPEKRACHISNISFPNLDANLLIRETLNLAVSNGSACNAEVFEPSHVLTAMGVPRELAYGAIRFSLSKFNTAAEIDQAIKIIKKWCLPR